MSTIDCCCPGGDEPPHRLFGCPCNPVPNHLFMHVTSVSSPQILVFPAAIDYQARPADLNQYASDATGWYSGKFTSSDSNLVFRYWFGCAGGLYFVQGLMTPDSPLGYPGRFLIATYLIGSSLILHINNTCSPFSLQTPATNNTTFQAQNPRIDGTGPA